MTPGCDHHLPPNLLCTFIPEPLHSFWGVGMKITSWALLILFFLFSSFNHSGFPPALCMSQEGFGLLISFCIATCLEVLLFESISPPGTHQNSCPKGREVLFTWRAPWVAVWLCHCQEWVWMAWRLSRGEMTFTAQLWRALRNQAVSSAEVLQKFPRTLKLLWDLGVERTGCSHL